MDKLIENLIKSKVKTVKDLHAFKRAWAKKVSLPLLSNIELLKSYHAFCVKRKKNPDKKLELLLRKRAIRSLSGVAVVSVLTKPYPCPGKCLYCPTEKGMPKSYLSNEPAVMRAVLNDFDPKRQVVTRIKALEMQGHPTDKIELIIIGGTWSYLPKQYQEQFIKSCFDAANNKTGKDLISSQKINENAKHRIVGITIETRPDYINEKEILQLRKLGVTRVELGVQSTYDDVLKYNLRGNTVKDIITATKLLKDAGFKVCYHMMPNLPGSTIKKDESMFKELFNNPNFQPDLLKIYTCAVLKEAPLYKLWKQGKYKPYTEKQLVDLLIAIKKQIPYYCRIQRLTRDIPSQSIVAGPAKISNMRQVLEKKVVCKCIRCREVKGFLPNEKIYLFKEECSASGGKEIFLSYENKERTRLYSLLRLRLGKTAIIREVHTYGQLHPLKGKLISPQHKGLGKKLIIQAEKLAKGYKTISVISGVGVRGYYRKLGYRLNDTYMEKKKPTAK